MTAAGETIIAGKIPGERIATTIRTEDSSNVTSEAVIDTVEAAVVEGRTYRVTWDLRMNSSVAGDDALASIREDSVTGTIIAGIVEDIPIVNRQGRTRLECEYTADATEDKTFVGTLSRVAGSGNVHGDASTGAPTLLYVEYVRG
jgi:hypothetical protein